MSNDVFKLSLICKPRIHLKVFDTSQDHKAPVVELRVWNQHLRCYFALAGMSVSLSDGMLPFAVRISTTMSLVQENCGCHKQHFQTHLTAATNLIPHFSFLSLGLILALWTTCEWCASIVRSHDGLEFCSPWPPMGIH